MVDGSMLFGDVSGLLNLHTHSLTKYIRQVIYVSLVNTQEG